MVPSSSVSAPQPRDASHDVELSPPRKAAPVTWASLPHKKQLAILALVRVVDFFQVASLQAYMFHQLKSFDPDLPDSTISFQTGVLQGVFTSAQIVTAIVWGRVADASWAGRKFVLLVGLIGTGLSCIGVGYSRTFAVAAVFRMLGGASNGTVGAARTMIAETVDKKYHPRAFLLLPLAFNIANILGPSKLPVSPVVLALTDPVVIVFGGLLADPVTQYPGHLGPNSKLATSSAVASKGVQHLMKYPYAPPNMLSAVLLFLEAALVWLGLRETLASRKYLRDRGLEVADTFKYWIRSITFGLCGYKRIEHDKEPGSAFAMDEVEEMPATPHPTTAKDLEIRPAPKQTLPISRIWTRNVVMVLLTTAIFDFQMGGFASLWLVFLSSARYDPSAPEFQNHPRNLPFHFTGGLAFPPSTTGFAMAILGVIGVTLQFLMYPKINARFGLLRSFRYSLYLFPVAYALAPYLSLLPSSTSPPYQATGPLVWLGISVVLFFQVLARTFALPATIILLNNCSPHPSVLGTIHGLGSSASSTFRTFGPIVAGKWYAIGLERGIVGTAWWGIAFVSVIGVVASYWVYNGSGHEIKLPGEEEEAVGSEKRAS